MRARQTPAAARCAAHEQESSIGGRAAQACASRLAAGLLIVALALLSAAAPARALPADGNGNYTQILCADPASQQGLGIAGMPEGLSNPASVDTWQITSSQVDCAGGQLSARSGVPIAVGQSGEYPQGTWSALLYQAPANITINAGSIYRAERAEGPSNGFMGIDQQGGEYAVLYSLPGNREDSGDWYAGNIASRGTFAEPFSPANLVNLTISPDGGHWDVNATCDPDGNNNSSCTLNAGQWEYRIYGGAISLHAPQDPQASDITGPLTTDSPLTGSESVTFSATDQGPGVAYVKTIVDGNVIQSETADANNGRCVPLAGADAYTWAYQIPCKTSLGGRTHTLNTATLANGEHHIQVLIEDAAGNQSIILDRTVEVENPPGGAAVSSASAPGVGASLPAPAAIAAPSEIGTLNGSGASESAQLHLDGPARVVRSFAQRALAVSGQLTGAGGSPIAGAILDVREQAAQSATAALIAHATTTANGSFTVRVAPGPSRTITIGYRALSSDIAYSAQASVAETVNAGVQLHIRPPRTSSTGTIQITGQVDGPIPRAGVLVELLVHYRGAWVPFRAPRTNTTGRFKTAYQFQGATGHFPFRAQIPAGQVGFPYAGADSNTVTVTSG